MTLFEMSAHRETATAAFASFTWKSHEHEGQSFIRLLARQGPPCCTDHSAGLVILIVAICVYLRHLRMISLAGGTAILPSRQPYPQMMQMTQMGAD